MFKNERLYSAVFFSIGLFLLGLPIIFIASLLPPIIEITLLVIIGFILSVMLFYALLAASVYEEELTALHSKIIQLEKKILPPPLTVGLSELSLNENIPPPESEEK